MISLLIGSLELIDNNDITLLVGGVWYSHCSVKTILTQKSEIPWSSGYIIIKQRQDLVSSVLDTMEDKRSSVNSSQMWCGPNRADSFAAGAPGQNRSRAGLSPVVIQKTHKSQRYGTKLASKIIVELRGSRYRDTSEYHRSSRKKIKTGKIYSEIDQSIITSLVWMGYDRKTVETLSTNPFKPHRHRRQDSMVYQKSSPSITHTCYTFTATGARKIWEMNSSHSVRYESFKKEENIQITLFT